MFKEILASMILNFAVHLALLTPLIILAINIFERQDILVNSIGAFPEEIKAHEQIQWMIVFCYPLLILLTILQVVSYYLYNGRFHPFALIVMPEKDKKRKIPNPDPNQSTLPKECIENSLDHTMEGIEITEAGQVQEQDVENLESETEIILDSTIKTSSDMESVL